MKWQRNEMKRLDATDDPRPMSVSLRPQNGQLSIKDEKEEEVKQEKKRVFQEINTKFFLYLQKYNKEHEKSFCCKMDYRSLFCFFLKKKSTTNCESKAKTPTTESTHRMFFWATERRYCVPQFVQKEESVSLYFVNKIRRKEGSGGDNIVRCFYAQVDVHTTQFLLNVRSGSSQSSLKDVVGCCVARGPNCPSSWRSAQGFDLIQVSVCGEGVPDGGGV